MSLRRLIEPAVLLTFMFSLPAPASKAETANAAPDAFKQRVKPFLESYCFDCHDNETRKGGVSLESLSDVSADNASMWKRVWEQVALKEMPPRKKTN